MRDSRTNEHRQPTRVTSRQSFGRPARAALERGESNRGRGGRDEPATSPEGLSFRGHPPRPGAPGLRRMHGRAELPAAQGLRLAELGGDRGPAGQHRIDHVPGLVEGLQRSGPGSPHRAGLPGQPHAPAGRRAGPAGPRPAGHRRRRDLPADAAGHRVRPVLPDERPSRHRRRLPAAASRTGNPRSGPRPAGSSTSGDGSGAASNRPTRACSRRSRTTTTRSSR